MGSIFEVDLIQAHFSHWVSNMLNIIPNYPFKGYHKHHYHGCNTIPRKNISSYDFMTARDETEQVELDKSNQRVQRMFGQIAARYDRMNHLLSMNVDHYWRWRTVRKVAPQGTAPILDICSGTGDLAFAYCHKADGATEIVAADFTREMLQIGEQKKSRRESYERIRFVEADAQHLPFDDDVFQIVSVAFGLRNIADTDRGLQEMMRVCQPGGRVVVLEFSQPTWQPFKGFYGFYMKYILPRIGQILAGNDEQAYKYLPDSVSKFPFGQELADRMEANGLVEACYYSLTGGIATLYVACKPETELSSSCHK
jgi:demethylmenaquinone methyltransferase/2-methoxy-6-polyprenyl-1,4-benzoquinol methylase